MAKSPKTLKVGGNKHKSRAAVESTAIRKHATLIGRVTYNWNVLHSTLQLIFATIVGDKTAKNVIQMNIGKESWDCLRSDDAQRAVLAAFAKYKLSYNPDLLEALNWLLSQAGQLSTYRNDATHVPFQVSNVENKSDILPNSFAADIKRVARLNTVGHVQLFKALSSDLSNLGKFGYQIVGAVMFDRLGVKHKRPLPQKPKLRAHLLVAQPPQGNRSRQQRT